ncbi:MAG: Phenylacetic acid catabolic protein [Pseudomonadota bacterium]
MADETTLSDYLAQGGRLTNPTNVPARYRAELMKMMSTFVDSELAGAAGFADLINAGPGIKERIAAAKIVLEKTDHADRVLRLMGEFGANTDRYAASHPWTERVERDAAPGADRDSHDMRLSVMSYPLDGWVDAVTMNFVTGHAVLVQLQDMARVSYQPFAEAIKVILPRETRHVELAEEGLARLVAAGSAREIAASLAYWRPRAAAVFGDPSKARLAQLKSWGLRHCSAAEMRTAWEQRLAAGIERIGLTATP